MEYGYAADRVSIPLEKKEHMKARGLASPDDADVLALTFAEPAMPREPAWLDPGRYAVRCSRSRRWRISTGS